MGYVLDVAWSRTPGLSEEETLNDRYDFFHSWEHYHWSMILMMAWLFLGWDALLGIAAAFFTSEWIQDPERPFGLGKDHFPHSTIIGLVLASILIILLVATHT